MSDRWFKKTRMGIWAPLFVLLAVFLLQWLLLMNVLAPTWDAAFYYSYARSLVFDQDLHIENDLKLSYATASPDFVASEPHEDRTTTGAVYAPFAIGSGLLWLPLLALLRLVATAAGLPAGTGFEWYFVAPVATFSALTGLLAFYLAYLLASREAGRASALLATLTLTFATPLIYYQFREPLYAHIPSALFNTLVLIVWWRNYRRIPSVAQGALMGALLALAALTRWQNAIYGFLPLVSTLWVWASLKPDNRSARLPEIVSFLAILGGVFLLFFSPQLFVWRSDYGSWLTIPQGGEFMTWRAPYIKELLFSPFRGLLPWMPVFALASVGLVAKARRKPRLALPLLVLLVISTYINASSRDWFAGGGYGPRRSAGELAIFVLGYAWLLSLLSARLRLLLGVATGVILALHQWLLLRFALAERIGGRVLSMAPQFEWTEGTLAEFVAQLGAHLPEVLRQPLDVFVFAGSPLHHLLQSGHLPFRHIAGVLAAGAFCGIFLLLVAAVHKGRQFSQRTILLQ